MLSCVKLCYTGKKGGLSFEIFTRGANSLLKMIPLAVALIAFGWVPSQQLSRPAVQQLSCHAVSLQMRADGEEQTQWRQRLRSAGTSLAAAALVTGGASSGAALAAESVRGAGSAGTSTRCIRRTARKAGAASLGFIDVGTDTTQRSVVDKDVLHKLKREVKAWDESEILFDKRLTADSLLHEEYIDLEESDQHAERFGKVGGVLPVVSVTGALFGLYNFAKAAERFIFRKDQEEIESEIELTGGYVSVDASDVETAFDPTSGKNITFTAVKEKREAKEAKEKAVEDAFLDGLPSPEEEVKERGADLPKWVPQFFREAPTSDDDEDFWDDGPKEPKTFRANPDAPDGESNAKLVLKEEGWVVSDEDDDDDTSGLDELDGLLK